MRFFNAHFKLPGERHYLEKFKSGSSSPRLGNAVTANTSQTAFAGYLIPLTCILHGANHLWTSITSPGDTEPQDGFVSCIPNTRDVPRSKSHALY